jgi:hypothetical protein
MAPPVVRSTTGGAPPRGGAWSAQRSTRAGRRAAGVPLSLASRRALASARRDRVALDPRGALVAAPSALDGQAAGRCPSRRGERGGRAPRPRAGERARHQARTRRPRAARGRMRPLRGVQRRALRPRRPARWLATVRSTCPVGTHRVPAGPARGRTWVRRLPPPHLPPPGGWPRQRGRIGHAGGSWSAAPCWGSAPPLARWWTPSSVGRCGTPPSPCSRMASRRPDGREVRGGLPSAGAQRRRGRRWPRASARGDSVVGLAVRWPRVITPGCARCARQQDRKGRHTVSRLRRPPARGSHCDSPNPCNPAAQVL